MRGKKVKAIRKMQYKCDHHVNFNKTRSCATTLHYIRCEDCGAKLDRLRPLSATPDKAGGRWARRLPAAAKAKLAKAAQAAAMRSEIRKQAPNAT